MSKPDSKPSAPGPQKPAAEAPTTPAPDTVPLVPAAELDALRAAHAAELEQLRAAQRDEINCVLFAARAESKAEIARADEVLETERAVHRDELAALRARFDRAWKERDEEDAARVRRMEETAAPLVLPEGAPRAAQVIGGRPRQLRAKHIIYCTVRGERAVIQHGKPIPEGADLAGVDPSAIEEV